MNYQQYPGRQPPAPRQRNLTWAWIGLAAITAVMTVAVVLSAVGRSNRDQSSAAATVPATATETTSKPTTGTATETAETTGTRPAPVAETETVTPSGPDTGMSSGVYQVGVDVRPGRYKTPGPAPDAIIDLCYWARLTDDSGEFDAIIANGMLEGPGSLTINDGEFVDLSGDCTWTFTG